MSIEAPPAAQLMKALAEREALLRGIFQNPLCAIVITDGFGAVQSASEAALRLLDVDLAAVLGKTLDELLEHRSMTSGSISTVRVRRDNGAFLEWNYAEEQLPDGLRVGVFTPRAPTETELDPAPD